MDKVDVRKRNIGVQINKETTDVRVWAPEKEFISLCINDKKTIPLHKEELGYWSLSTKELQINDSYRFIINEKDSFPDPASLAQPQGVHGPSMAIDLTQFKWTDQKWNNIDQDQYLIYELHTGTFSPEGTFMGIEKKLTHLKQLGINAIEIMPIAQFPGARNWGYDGVYPFAVQNTYGGAYDLQHLVNACHENGLAVILDVVYNHLGPEGNYLSAYGPYFTDKYKTPWGGAINFDDAWSDGVRNYYIENVLMWFRDFHIDALRLDAVHAIKDLGPVHILQEIKKYINELMAQTGQRHYLFIEFDLNDKKFIDPFSKNGYGMDAQWIDEFHHALRVTAGGERNGYYSDFNGIEHLAKAYKDAYVYDGQFSQHRKKKFGIKASEHKGEQFIVFSQNHDQVGNRMLGERTSMLASFEMQKLLAGAVMTSPYIPMLFMGEEWQEPHPFLYFVSHTDPALAEAVRKGRKEEFSAFHADGEAPDPVSEQSFNNSKLQWNLLKEKPFSSMFDYYKELVCLRKTDPVLRRPDRKNLVIDCRKEANMLVLHRWNDEYEILCIMNFSKRVQSYMLLSHVHQWIKKLDSADPKWEGPLKAPDMVSGGVPGAQALAVQPESILIYASK